MEKAIQMHRGLGLLRGAKRLYHQKQNLALREDLNLDDVVLTHWTEEATALKILQKKLVELERLESMQREESQNTEKRKRELRARQRAQREANAAQKHVSSLEAAARGINRSKEPPSQKQAAKTVEEEKPKKKPPVPRFKRAKAKKAAGEIAHAEYEAAIADFKPVVRQLSKSNMGGQPHTSPYYTAHQKHLIQEAKQIEEGVKKKQLEEGPAYEAHQKHLQDEKQAIFGGGLPVPPTAVAQQLMVTQQFLVEALQNHPGAFAKALQAVSERMQDKQRLEPSEFSAILLKAVADEQAVGDGEPSVDSLTNFVNAAADRQLVTPVGELSPTTKENKDEHLLKIVEMERRLHSMEKDLQRKMHGQAINSKGEVKSKSSGNLLKEFNEKFYTQRPGDDYLYAERLSRLAKTLEEAKKSGSKDTLTTLKSKDTLESALESGQSRSILLDSSVTKSKETTLVEPSLETPPESLAQVAPLRLEPKADALTEVANKTPYQKLGGQGGGKKGKASPRKGNAPRKNSPKKKPTPKALPSSEEVPRARVSVGSATTYATTAATTAPAASSSASSCHDLIVKEERRKKSPAGKAAAREKRKQLTQNIYQRSYQGALKFLQKQAEYNKDKELLEAINSASDVLNQSKSPSNKTVSPGAESPRSPSPVQAKQEAHQLKEADEEKGVVVPTIDHFPIGPQSVNPITGSPIAGRSPAGSPSQNPKRSPSPNAQLAVNVAVPLRFIRLQSAAHKAYRPIPLHKYRQRDSMRGCQKIEEHVQKAFGAAQKLASGEEQLQRYAASLQSQLDQLREEVSGNKQEGGQSPAKQSTSPSVDKKKPAKTRITTTDIQNATRHEAGSQSPPTREYRQMSPSTFFERDAFFFAEEEEAEQKLFPGRGSCFPRPAAAGMNPESRGPIRHQEMKREMDEFQRPESGGSELGWDTCSSEIDLMRSNPASRCGTRDGTRDSKPMRSVPETETIPDGDGTQTDGDESSKPIEFPGAAEHLRDSIQAAAVPPRNVTSVDRDDAASSPQQQAPRHIGSYPTERPPAAAPPMDEQQQTTHRPNAESVVDPFRLPFASRFQGAGNQQRANQGGDGFSNQGSMPHSKKFDGEGQHAYPNININAPSGPGGHPNMLNVQQQMCDVRHFDHQRNNTIINQYVFGGNPIRLVQKGGTTEIHVEKQQSNSPPAGSSNRRRMPKRRSRHEDVVSDDDGFYLSSTVTAFHSDSHRMKR